MSRVTWPRWLLGMALLALLACQTLAPPLTLSPHTATVPAPLPTSAKQSPPISPVMRDRHRRIFRRVWSAVQRDYVYDDYNGVDWDAVRAEFEPQLEVLPDDEAFWALMQALIERLDDQHSTFITPTQALEEDQAMSGELDYVGVGIFVTAPEGADYGVVLFPLPNSPAEAAGLRPHDRILTIDGQPACCAADGRDNLDLLTGPPGSAVRLTVQYPGEPAREILLHRARVQSQIPILSRRIPTAAGDVGYLLIPTLWDSTIATRTRERLAEMQAEGDLVGLIIDMRINGGGAYTELYALLSLFVEGEVGHFTRRNGRQQPLHVRAAPLGDSLELPLVILVGRDTESYAEVFSGVLQDVGRARLVGQPTAGNVETIYPYDLEDGSRLWLAQETFRPPSGAEWETRGVIPDVRIPGRWEDFTAANDAQLEAALALLTP